MLLTVYKLSLTTKIKLVHHLRTILNKGAIVALLLKPTRCAIFLLLIGLCFSGPVGAGVVDLSGVSG